MTYRISVYRFFRITNFSYRLVQLYESGDKAKYTVTRFTNH